MIKNVTERVDRHMCGQRVQSMRTYRIKKIPLEF